MAFDELFFQINEIIQQSVRLSKEEVLADSRYSDVTASQLVYLEAVSALSSPTLSGLAARLKITRASASIAVNKLIENGFLVKVRARQDKRYCYLSLSEKGEALIKAEKRAFSHFADAIKHSLTKAEIEMIEKIFIKIINKYGTEIRV
jgi:DNA-binding MarR family transcriptional regulator